MNLTSPQRQLRARSVAYALLGRILGADPTPLTDDATIDALGAALDIADARSALALIEGVARHAHSERDDLAGRWVRWFDLGRVAPYEGSNVPTIVGGITPRLADVAGFYRAFEVTVVGDRPDHVVAQLEFLALTLIAEARAGEQNDPQRAEIAAQATRSFLRDHIGTWIDAWAARVGAVDDLAPWAPYAACAAALVHTEAAIRNVIPLREDALLLADTGVADDDEAILSCGDGSDEPLDADASLSAASMFRG